MVSVFDLNPNLLRASSINSTGKSMVVRIRIIIFICITYVKKYYFICTVKGVGLPATTVTFSGADLSVSCQTRSS